MDSDYFSQMLYAFPGISVLAPWFNSLLIIDILQQMALLFVVAFLFSRSGAFGLLVKDSLRTRDWLLLYLIFFAISAMGSVLASNVPLTPGGDDWTQVDTRSIGAVLAGFLGGPLLGTAVGFTAGLYRWSLGGPTAMAGFIGTTLVGLIAGLVYMFFLKKNQEVRFGWKIAVVATCVGELIMKVLVLLTVQPFDKALALIQITTVPSLIGNSIGAALFVTILNDKERLGVLHTTTALRMAKRLVDVLKYGFNKSAARAIVNIIRGETQIATVAITDHTNKVMAITGVGADHHHVGDEIVADLVQNAIDQQRVIFINGSTDRLHCATSANCPLHSALIAPLIVEGNVLGVLLLIEPKRRFFPKLNRALGVGVAELLSEQMQLAMYQEQLASAKHKLLIAQINPHFLSNALNTISAIVRTDTARGRELLTKLAFLMRKSIKYENEISTLEEELEHMDAHLSIDLARYGDKLRIEKNIEPKLMNALLPSFVLQPLVENAVKHGTSRLLIPGIIQIRAYQTGDGLIKIEVKDNAGQYQPKLSATQGLGMKNVEGRIKTLFGRQYGLSIDCSPNQHTSVTITIPFRDQL
ncbi:MAG: histidine kinase [Gammaproteobacteria bacterium]|nr:histidine kinase [Gammaproteobacteria bacterium]